MIEFKSDYYLNELIVTDSNTKVRIDISSYEKIGHARGYYVDKSQAEVLFSLLDDVSNSVKDSENFRAEMVKRYFSDVFEVEE